MRLFRSSNVSRKANLLSRTSSPGHSSTTQSTSRMRSNDSALACRGPAQQPAGILQQPTAWSSIPNVTRRCDGTCAICVAQTCHGAWMVASSTRDEKASRHAYTWSGLTRPPESSCAVLYRWPGRPRRNAHCVNRCQNSCSLLESCMSCARFSRRRHGIAVVVVAASSEHALPARCCNCIIHELRDARLAISVCYCYPRYLIMRAVG
jgi:hypothetical protein